MKSIFTALQILFFAVCHCKKNSSVSGKLGITHTENIAVKPGLRKQGNPFTPGCAAVPGIRIIKHIVFISVADSKSAVLQKPHGQKLLTVFRDRNIFLKIPPHSGVFGIFF